MNSIPILENLEEENKERKMSQHGFTALPRDINVLLNGRKNIKTPEPVTVNDIMLPETPLAEKVQEFAKRELREETYNQYIPPLLSPLLLSDQLLNGGNSSMRVYYFGRAIQEQQFPDWDLSAETYLITALLHDIGTTEKHMAATKMSFEFYGGFLAHEFLVKHDVELAEAVAEAVIRHQDLGTSGKITSLGLLIQLATILGML